MGVPGKTQPTRGIFGCVCAEAASGHPTAAPPRSVMKSRRLTRSPRSTQMPEYQMTDPSAKAIAASQSAEAREDRFGSITPPADCLLCRGEAAMGRPHEALRCRVPDTHLAAPHEYRLHIC